MSRHNRFSISGIEPPDLQKEKEGILCLQTMERKVDHSVSFSTHFQE